MIYLDHPDMGTDSHSDVWTWHSCRRSRKNDPHREMIIWERFYTEVTVIVVSNWSTTPFLKQVIEPTTIPFARKKSSLVGHYPGFLLLQQLQRAGTGCCLAANIYAVWSRKGIAI